MAEVSSFLWASIFFVFSIPWPAWFNTKIFLVIIRAVEDFRDWTNWLLYRGGIGVKGEESWEAWWDEEIVCPLLLFLAGFLCLTVY